MGPNYSTGNQNHTYHPCSWWMNDKRSPMAFLETTIQVTYSDATCMPHLHKFLQILSFGDVPPTTLEFWLKVKGKINPNHSDKLEVCFGGSHLQLDKSMARCHLKSPQVNIGYIQLTSDASRSVDEICFVFCGNQPNHSLHMACWKQ